MAHSLETYNIPMLKNRLQVSGWKVTWLGFQIQEFLGVTAWKDIFDREEACGRDPEGLKESGKTAVKGRWEGITVSQPWN